MSVENNVFVHRERLPAPAAWRRAILDAGFEMELDTEFEWERVAGFVPCRYRDGEGGFELYMEPLDPAGISAQERTIIGARNCVITTVSRSDVRGYMTSMIASAVLCAMCDGVLAEGGAAPFITAVDAIRWARGCESGIRPPMREQQAPD